MRFRKNTREHIQALDDIAMGYDGDETARQIAQENLHEIEQHITNAPNLNEEERSDLFTELYSLSEYLGH